MPKKKKQIEDPREIIEDLDRISKKLESHIDKERTGHKRRKHHPRKTESKLGYIIAIGVNLGLWYAAKNIAQGSFVFMKDVSRVLSVFNLSVAVNALGNFIFLFYDQGKFKNLVKVAINLVGMFFIYKLYTVFPFDFSSYSNSTTLDLVVKMALLVSVIGMGVATIIETLPLFLED